MRSRKMRVSRQTDDRVEMDPDKRVRKAISLVFVKFRELGSIRQVLLWLRQESIELPSVSRKMMAGLV